MTRTVLPPFAFAALALIVGATPVFAQTPSRKELGQRVDVLESNVDLTDQRLLRLEETLLTGDPAAVRLQDRVDVVESALARLTGELESALRDNRELRDEITVLRRQLRLSGGLDPDLFPEEPALNGSTDGAPTSAPVDGGPLPLGAARETDPAFYGDDPFASAKAQASGSLGDTTAVVLPTNPTEALDAAKSLLIKGRFGEAEQAFAQFVDTFPDAPQIGEALFWQGETYFLRDDFEAAKNLYIDALRADPKGVRAPDAMIKLAASLTKIGEPAEACRTLDAFDKSFPSADVSARSKARRQRDAAACS